MSNPPASPAQRRVVYGRRRGRPRRPGRQRLLDTALAGLAISLANANTGRLNPRTLFPPATRDIWLEIGFGAGEHLAEQATANPSVGFIGCEPYLEGVASLLRHRSEQDIPNIRLFTDDVRVLVDALESASIGRVFMLFPDPWPKRRHHKRRLVTAATVRALARVMSAGAELRIATDHCEYCRWTLWHVLAHPAFEWTAMTASDWRNRPADWPETRYEAKAIAAGRCPMYLTFRRRPAEQNARKPGDGRLR